MPPRVAKRAVSAKKTTPKSKRLATRSNAVEETKVSSPSENLSTSPVEVTKLSEVEAPSSAVAEVAVTNSQVAEATSSVVVEVAVTNSQEAEVFDSTDKESVVVKEEASVTTVVVEETTITEETMTTTTTEEIVEEKKPEIDGLNADADVEMDGNAALENNVEEAEEEENDENEGDESDPEPEEDATLDVVEEEVTAIQDTEGGGGDGDGDDNGGDSEDGGEEGEDESETENEDDEEDVNFSAYMQQVLTDKKKQAHVEIFVGGLNRKAVEEDLIKVFGEYGEIKAVRIVKHPVTQKSKGFAFIRFATVEQAKKVLTELKDGIEVKGKRVGVSQSQDSDTLYMGNIRKTWTKEQILETLKGFGIEHIEEIYLPEDPKTEGKIRGFAYLEFSTHSDAMAAFQRLRKPDAVFGHNRSAKIAFAPSMHPSEEALSQVKTVYVEGLTVSWDEDKLRQLCEQYGEAEKVQLSRDLVTTKRKDFAFVSFTSRENAIACVEGINNAKIEEGDVKVKANLAKPQYKGRLGKKAARGGYRVQKDGEKIEETGKSKTKGGAMSKGDKGKEKVPPKTKGAGGDRRRNEQPAKGRKRDGKSMDFGRGRPSKKPRGNARTRPTHGFGNRVNSSLPGRARPAQNYGRTPASYADPYAQGYTSYGAVSGSERVYSDMEPHAGYLRPSTRGQGRDLYGYELRRASGFDARGSGATSYGGESVLPPSYVPGYSRYAGYEGGGTAGGYIYPSSGAYSYPRSYY